jgi:hypothetical protein
MESGMSKTTCWSGATLVLLFPSGIIHAQDTESARAEMGFVAARGNSSTETANAKIEMCDETDHSDHRGFRALCPSCWCAMKRRAW